MKWIHVLVSSGPGIEIVMSANGLRATASRIAEVSRKLVRKHHSLLSFFLDGMTVLPKDRCRETYLLFKRRNHLQLRQIDKCLSQSIA